MRESARRLCLPLLIAVLLVAPALAQTPSGDQFQVNITVAGTAARPAVGIHANGDFVVAFDNYAYVYGRRFDSSTAPLSGEFDISDVGFGGDNFDPMISIGGDDNAAIGWFLHDAGDGALARRFDNAGVALDPNPLIAGLSEHEASAIAAEGDGDFIITWQDAYQIEARRYVAGGGAAGPVFAVTSSASINDYDRNPSIGASDSSGFVVVWQTSYYGDPDPCEIKGQRLDASGSLVGAAFAVNSITTGCQGSAAIAVEADGDFTVVWTSYSSAGTDTSGTSIQARRFAADASPEAVEFQVNTVTTGAQSTVRKAIGFAPDGSFVIVWQSDSSAGDDVSGSSIQARAFDASGTALGDDFQVNTYTTNAQKQAAVGLGQSGDFVVSWTSDGSPGTDNTSTSIQARRYTLSQVVNVPLLSPLLRFVLPAGLLAVGVWTTARAGRANKPRFGSTSE